MQTQLDMKIMKQSSHFFTEQKVATFENLK